MTSFAELILVSQAHSSSLPFFGIASWVEAYEAALFLTLFCIALYRNDGVQTVVQES